VGQERPKQVLRRPSAGDGSLVRLASAISFALLVIAGPVLAGQNSAGKLAMHLVASEEVLTCEDLLPLSCEAIDSDLSAAELQAANGYGYLAFIAYDVTSVKGVEFAVDGFPSGRGGPVVQGPHWCAPGALSMGHILDGGGIVSGGCIEPDPVSGLAVLAYLSFHYTGEDPLYIDYAPSTFSHRLDPQSFFLDCSTDYVEDMVTYETGGVIGGQAYDLARMSRRGRRHGGRRRRRTGLVDVSGPSGLSTGRFADRGVP